MPGDNTVGRSRRNSAPPITAQRRRTPMIGDRQYQRDIVAQFQIDALAYMRILLVAPTGAGKTIIAAAIILDYLRHGKRVLVLCHRREIIAQTDGKLRELNVWSSIIMAVETELPRARVKLASDATH